MRIFTAYDKMAEDVVGAQGTMSTLDFVTEDDLNCGLRTVKAGSSPKVVANDNRAHRRLVFVVKGSATITNGEYYEKITPGTFVLFEPGERPFFQTAEEDLVVLEVSWTPEKAPEPHPDAPKHFERREAPKTLTRPGSSGVYMEV